MPEIGKRFVVALALLLGLAPVAPVVASGATPTATAQSFSTDKNTAYNGQLTGTDPENDPLTFLGPLMFQGPFHGTVSNWNSSTGTFTYTPHTNYVGTDYFHFKVNDGTSTSAAAKVSITVTGPNEAPVAQDQSFSVEENTSYNGQVTATDADGDTLTYHKLSSVYGPFHGTVSNWNKDTGTFTYTPATDYVGSDSFKFVAKDPSTQSDAATVSITVTGANTLPVANNMSFSLDENTSYNGTLDVTDADGDDLTYHKKLYSGPNNGTLTLNQDTGAFTYTPNTDYVGTDSFEFYGEDASGVSNFATASITVNGVNSLPVANDMSVTTDKNTPVSGTLDVTDADGDTLTYHKKLYSGPAHGTVTINSSTGAYTYTPNTDYVGSDSFQFYAEDASGVSNFATASFTVNGTNEPPTANNLSISTDEDTPVTGTVTGSDPENSTVTFSYFFLDGPTHGDVTSFDSATGQFTYVPDSGYVGTDSFKFSAFDGNFYSETKGTVTITVNAANTAPVASDLEIATDEDTSVTATLPATDADGDTLTFGLSTMVTPAHGTITVFNSTTGQFTYVPDTGYSGTDTFKFYANDGTVNSAEATVTVTVSAANSAPVAGDDSVSTNQDTAYSGSVSVTDGDSDPLTYSVVVQPENGSVTLNSTTGAYTYTPDAGFFGTDSFVYRANDGVADSNLATVTITVQWVNPLPGDGSLDIQDPIESDGSSVFNKARGVVPVKFQADATTCSLPTATVALYRVNGTVSSPVNEGEFFDPADGGVTYRVQGCQYHYNLESKNLGEGEYVVKALIEGNEVGSATFKLK